MRQRSSRYHVTLATLLLNLSLALGQPAIAAKPSSGPHGGDLDPAFGANGTAVTSLRLYDQATAIAIQDDAKIVVAGRSSDGATTAVAIARYAPDGSPDLAFGVNGQILTSFGGSDDSGIAIAIQSDAKIVLAGYSNANGTYDFALARYNPDGTLDPTFGTNGLVLMDLGAGDLAAAMAIQGDGKIVVVGNSNILGHNTFALAQYTSDGRLDPLFGANGTVLTDFGASAKTAAALAVTLQPDGKIVAAGASGTTADFAVARYMPNGQLDGTFGRKGKVITNISSAASPISGVALQADGKIVAAGYAKVGGAFYFALARYTADGHLDDTFGDRGLAITPNSSFIVPSSSVAGAYAYATIIQPDGKIVATGTVMDIGGFRHFGLARYIAP